MSAANVTRTIAIVTACMHSDGTPTFARTEVEATEDQAQNGIHYYLAEAQLLAQGYEEPMVHFSESEAPAFLFPAIQEYLAVDCPVQIQILSEEA